MRVSSGMAIQVKHATTTTLNAEFRIKNGQFCIAGAIVQNSSVVTTSTPMKVTKAIFHCGSGRSGWPGKVNQLSNPHNSWTRPLPSVKPSAN